MEINQQIESFDQSANLAFDPLSVFKGDITRPLRLKDVLAFGNTLFNAVSGLLTVWSCERLEEAALRLALPPSRPSAFAQRLDDLYKLYWAWCAMAMEVERAESQIANMQKLGRQHDALDSMFKEARARASALEARATGLRLSADVKSISGLLQERNRAVVDSIVGIFADQNDAFDHVSEQLRQLERRHQVLLEGNQREIADLADILRAEMIRRGLSTERFKEYARGALTGVAGNGLTALLALVFGS